MTIGLRLKIKMLVNEKELIEKVKAYFGFGSIVTNIDGSIEFIILDISNILKIKEHYLKYPLRGTKYLDFLCFIRAVSIFEQKTHRTEEGFKLLVNLSYNMNSYRKDSSNFPPLHTIKNSHNYTPINGHFINGFIAGDDALYLRTKSNFGSSP